MNNLESFRQDVRSWLDAQLSAAHAHAVAAGRNARRRSPRALQASRDEGLARCDGREGLDGADVAGEIRRRRVDKEQHQVLQEELRRINARPALFGMGISMIGPALLEFGTDEQKAEHLPKIARGQIWWCQGYSEPNAGSDLASLKTSAVENGDEYIINGSKIWTSGAIRPTGFSVWCAPTRRRRNTTASRSFCSTSTSPALR